MVTVTTSFACLTALKTAEFDLSLSKCLQSQVWGSCKSTAKWAAIDIVAYCPVSQLQRLVSQNFVKYRPLRQKLGCTVYFRSTAQENPFLGTPFSDVFCERVLLITCVLCVMTTDRNNSSGTHWNTTNGQGISL